MNQRLRQQYEASRALFRAKRHPKVKMIAFPVCQGNSRPVGVLTNSWNGKEKVLVIWKTRGELEIEQLSAIVRTMSINVKRLLSELHN